MSSKLDYLKKYMSGPSSSGAPGGDDGKKKRKKKRPKQDGGGAGTIRIIDGDAGFAASAQEEEEKRKRAEEDRAVVLDARGREVDASVLEDANETERRAVQYMGIRDDGSGWAAVDGGEPESRGGRHDSDSEDEEPTAGRASGRHDSDSEEDVEPAPVVRADPMPAVNDDAAPDTAGGELQYDSDGDLIIPDEPEPAAGGGGELQYDSDGDLIIPDEPEPVEEAKPEPSRGAAKKEKAPKGRTMTDGTSTGLVSAAQVIMEAELKRKAEQARLAKLSDEQSGRGAATNYRDKATGKLMDSEELKQRAENTKPKERERPIWSAGVEQARMAKQYQADLEKAKDAPFAHADIDADFEDKQREAMRFGDPMAHLSRKKRQAAALNLPSVVDGLGLSAEDLKKSGFRIPQEAPPHSWLRRGIAAPHNRYNIKPGRHWDGVDRGTGFEVKMFKKKNELRERAQLEDMDAEEHNEWF